MREEKPYECSICKIGFRSKYHWTQHLSIHNMTKPNKCTICESSFTAKWSLTNHMIAVHEGKRPYHCSVCHWKCRNRLSLNKHFKKTGHISSDPESANENKCSICNISYAKTAHLTVHNASLHSMILVLSDIML